MRHISKEWIHEASVNCLKNVDWTAIGASKIDPFVNKSPTRLYIYYSNPMKHEKRIYWGGPAKWIAPFLHHASLDRNAAVHMLYAEWDRSNPVMLFCRRPKKGRDGPTFVNRAFFNFYHPQYIKSPADFRTVWFDLSIYNWKRFEDHYRFSPVLSVQKNQRLDAKKAQLSVPDIVNPLQAVHVEGVHYYDQDAVRRIQQGYNNLIDMQVREINGI